MDSLTIVMLAICVAMDAFAVSISNGIYFKDYNKKQIFYTSCLFGLFQGIMPVIGYEIGIAFYHIIAFIDHWIAFLLLASIGSNMILEGLKSYKNKENTVEADSFSLQTILLQGIATSIDALAIGISIAITNTNILTSSLTIGFITFILCLIGAYLGKKINVLSKEKATIIGGIVLIAIGLKILIEHLMQHT